MASNTASLSATGSATLNKLLTDTLTVVQISGTYGSCQFVFEATPDGANWSPVGAIRFDTGGEVNGTLSPADNSTLCWKIPSEMMTGVRLRLTAYGSGTVAVALFSASFVGSPYISVQQTYGSTIGASTFSGDVTLQGLLNESNVDALTAHAGGGQGSALALSKEVNRISTVATAGDSVKLPASVAGLSIIVINSGANSMQVYGAGTDTINDVATATGVAQQPNSIEVYACPVAGKWYADMGQGFSASFFTESSLDSVTAHAGGGQGSAVLLTGQTNRIATVATIADSVKLPVSAAGLEVVVINHGANSMQVFGSGTDTINDVATATGVPQMTNSVVLYTCATAGSWYSEGLGTGFGASGLQTASFTNSITAFSGGGQSSAQALTSMLNRVATVAAQGDSVRLPASAPGLEIMVVNRGANSMQVFGAGTDTINGIATATGISQGVNTAAVYTCAVAGNWEAPITSLWSTQPSVISASGAILPHTGHTYVVTKAGVAAMTLAAPTATTDDGIEITITSDTANAHTLTATGLLDTGTASVNLATFAANKGAGLALMAYNARWKVICSVGITFS